jgi:hypothetical protein
MEEHNYEECLKRAHVEGWRDPVKLSVLEIDAYKAGMLTERNRILSIFEDVSDGRPMRAIDLQRYIQRINKNAN